MEKGWLKEFLISKPKESMPVSFDYALLITTLSMVLFVPFLPISDSFFLSLEEILVAIIGVRLLLKGFFWIDRFVVILLLFAATILFSILINSHRTALNEYFELYKLVKLGVVYVFSIYLFIGLKNLDWIIKFINASFVLLVVFNFLHYFDVWNFNENITILYDPNKKDTMLFGLNSLGGPGTKRMLGTMGNPNDNAILFLIYFAFYQSRLTVLNVKHKLFYVNKFLFFLATLMVLLCQSRTGIFMGVVVYIIGLFHRKLTKEVLYELLLIGIAILLMLGISSQSLRYITNTKISLDDNSSVLGRMEIAKKLLSMWTSKPIFGYGPNKEYMYANKIYAENEYIFHLWRYGIVGLGLYCLTLWYLIVKFYREKVKMPLFIFVIVIFTIGALTNLPVMNPKFTYIFALISGFATCQYLFQKNKANESA